MARKELRKETIVLQLAMLLIILTLIGCANVRLISDYDEKTDSAITAFQKEMETFLTSLERNAGKDQAKYENNVKFYDEAKVELSAIRVRAEAIPYNTITVQQIDLLVDNVNKLEQLHKIGMTADDIKPLRTAFNVSCTAILKLEIAKKRGETK